VPLPNTRVIPARWSEYHRATATGTMTATCQITRRATAGTTDAAGTYTPASPTTIYTGVCRVQALATRQQVVVIGEAQETQHRYLVTIRYDAADIHIGDLVHVTASVDGGLIGRQLRVVDATYGSEQWERDLTCEELED
jgi:ribulose 1,5-bisphosphate carboxylase large subunit-like protein